MASNKKIYKIFFAIIILHSFNVCHSMTDEFNVLKKENKFEIFAKFKSFANVCSAWRLITSYEDLPSFLPKMISSKILINEGNKKVVKQVFKDSFFIFPFYLNNNFLVTELESEKKITVKLLSGNLNDYRANWQITKLKGLTIITIYAQITPTKTQSVFISDKRIRDHFNEMILSLKNKLNSLNHAHGCR